MDLVFKILLTFRELCVRSRVWTVSMNRPILPSYEQLKEDKLNYARSFYVQYCNTDPFSGKCLVEPYSDHLYVVQNPPAKPLSQDEMDLVYGLPYMRTYHPSYEKDGGVPAIKEIKFQSDQ